MDKTTVLLLTSLAFAGAASAGVVFEENFMNYGDRVPGAISGEEVGVDNDPIWSRTGSINLRLTETKDVYVKPLALPKDRFCLSVVYSFLNSQMPVAAKDDKPAVAADYSFFDLVFSAGDRRKLVRVAADEIAGTKLAKATYNRAWTRLDVKAKGASAELVLEGDKSITTVDLGFVPESVNFRATADRHFALQLVEIRDDWNVPVRAAENHFASFKSLAQPLTNAKTAAKDETLDLTPAPRAGLRLVLGATNRTSVLSVKWSDGSETKHPIRVGSFTEALPAAVLGYAKGTKLFYPDATIEINGYPAQHVRPRLRPFRSSYSIEPQGVDVIRDWEKLPPASTHALTLELVKAGDKVQLWLDGSYVEDLHPTRPRVKKGEMPPPLPTFVSAKVTFAGGERYAKRTYGKEDSAYLPLDFSANPRAKAMAEAKVSVAKGASFGGYPMTVAAPLDSADVAICHQAMGNWALEVEEYHGRIPTDGYPSAVHYRVPSAPYGRAGILFALDPDPKKDAILTLRLGRYVGNGVGGNMSAARTYDFTKGVPDWCRRVGEVTVGGKTLPLYFGDFALEIGPIVDLTLPGSCLDFDVTGKQWENFQQMDNSMKPDPRSTSAFNLFGVTLRKAPYAVRVVEKNPGNVFTADERERTMALRVEALADGAKGGLGWELRDIDGKALAARSEKFAFAKAGDAKDFAVDFGAKTPVGFYTCAVSATTEAGAPLFSHDARFVILPEAGRNVKAVDSPYATWWFDAHGSPGAAEIGFPILQKAGIRKSSWRKISKEDSEKWGALPTGNLYSLNERDFEMNADGVTGHFKGDTVMVPDPSDPKKKIRKERTGEERFVAAVQKSIDSQVWHNHLLIWHESGPKGGVPEELLGLEPPPPDERDRKQAAYVNEIGRLMRKHFPGVKIQIGNNSAAMGAASKPMRYGAKPEYFDCLGMETPAQVIPPERRTEVGVLGMLASQDVASRLAGRKIPLNGAWEFIYRADRDMGEELQAQWHARDVLISLAHDFFLISPGILFDCSNGYYNGLWGGAGLLRRAPFVYPKRAYVAYAVLTKVLDGVKFIRELDTGSSTVYALEYKRIDGKFVTALWCARGEATFALDGAGKGATVTEMYGAVSPLAADAKVAAGGRPVYVTTAKPLAGVRVVGRTFAADAALAAKAKTAAAFDKADDFTLAPDPEMESLHHNFFPVMKKSDFTMRTVKDEEKGDAVEVTLDLAKNAGTSPYYTEYTTLRFKNPAALAGKPELIGVWVKGNSNWGQIRFEITDANGEVFKNLTTGRSWCCDVQDWPGNLAVNFDGWNFVYTPLRETDLIPTHSPGPYSEQWLSTGGDKVIQYPVRVTAITVGMNRYPTSLFKFADKPGNPSIRLRDVGGVEK